MRSYKSLALSFAILLTAINGMPSQANAAAFLADITLSPVKTVLEFILSPFVQTFAATIATVNNPTSKQELINSVSNDAADHLMGAEPTPLLKEVHEMLRQELVRRGDHRELSDQELSQMILADLDSSSFQ